MTLYVSVLAKIISVDWLQSSRISRFITKQDLRFVDMSQSQIVKTGSGNRLNAHRDMLCISAMCQKNVQSVAFLWLRPVVKRRFYLLMLIT